jgi:hypothetical protein
MSMQKSDMPDLHLLLHKFAARMVRLSPGRRRWFKPGTLKRQFDTGTAGKLFTAVQLPVS